VKNQKGKVYLVGAGPGDCNLMTVRSHKLLSQAEVLIYDALIDLPQLELIPATCRKIEVGKRGGKPSTQQQEINRLLVEHCKLGKQIVRLKSGDPFIFGRSSSEIQALIAAGCEFEVIPGISSALSAPLLAGIPLTDPVMSRCFAVRRAKSERDRLAIASSRTIARNSDRYYPRLRPPRTANLAGHALQHCTANSRSIFIALRDGNWGSSQIARIFNPARKHKYDRYTSHH